MRPSLQTVKQVNQNKMNWCEFQALIEWLHLNIDCESKPAPERPTSVAWEVRKSVSGHMTFWHTFSKNGGFEITDLPPNGAQSSPQKLSNDPPIDSHAKSANESIVSDSGSEKENSSPKPALKETDKDLDSIGSDGSVTSDSAEERPPVAAKERTVSIDGGVRAPTGKPTIAAKATIKSSVSTPTLNTMTTSCPSKPLNPLAQTFKSRLHPMAPSSTTISSHPQSKQQLKTATPSPAVAAITTITTTTTAPVAQTKPGQALNGAATAPAVSVKRSVASASPAVPAPSVAVKPVTTQPVSPPKSEVKGTVPVMNKSFARETNSSRAKSVRNCDTNNNNNNNSNKNHKNNMAFTKGLARSQSNILSPRNGNNTNNNISNNNNGKSGHKSSANATVAANNAKNKRSTTKDADGWEVVGRGRQRYKVSPPKVIIMDDADSAVKTTADGTVYAVTAAVQTTDAWDPMSGSMSESADSLRTPGRALKIHEKLSSPSRKRNASPTESIKKHEEKLAKAQEAREKYLEEKAQKFKSIFKKWSPYGRGLGGVGGAEEMKAWKEEQQLAMRASMEAKHQRAEEKRQQQLNRIVRKAHDEDSKVNEIAFINELEAQNKKYDILSREKDREARRLQDMHDERHRRHEETKAKEAAVEERRKVLEDERQKRVQELQQRRREKDHKIELQFQEKEKERQEMATQKVRLGCGQWPHISGQVLTALERQSRQSAMNALYAQKTEELQKKIQQKYDESARRHEETLTQIRQKALELSVRKSSTVGNDDAPVCEPYDTCKLCQLCQVIIKSEVFLFGHLR
ncbi:unnamed protein product, partial [Medioppia subpectinata]